MNRKKLTGMLLSAGVIIAALAACQPINPSTSLTSSTSLTAHVGMGDLRLAESSNLAIPVTGQSASSRSYIGIGDLHLFESRQ